MKRQVPNPARHHDFVFLSVRMQSVYRNRGRWWHREAQQRQSVLSPNHIVDLKCFTDVPCTAAPPRGELSH